PRAPRAPPGDGGGLVPDRRPPAGTGRLPDEVAGAGPAGPAAQHPPLPLLAAGQAGGPPAAARRGPRSTAGRAAAADAGGLLGRPLGLPRRPPRGRTPEVARLGGGVLMATLETTPVPTAAARRPFSRRWSWGL